MSIGASKVVVDPLVTALSKGERPKTFGLNLNLLSPPPASIAGPIEEICARLDKSLYVYPSPHLHVTVFSLIPFTAPETEALLENSEKCAELEAISSEILEKLAIDHPDIMSGKLDIVADRIELGTNREGEPTAVIVRYSDPSGTIDRIRELIRAELDTNEKVKSTAIAACAKCPSAGFIHSTIARFPSQPSNIPDAVASINGVLETFSPVHVRSEGLRLVRELHPYMHLDVKAHTVWESPQN